MCMRTCALVIPERRVVIEATLYCNGFQKDKLYADKLNAFFDLITTQVSHVVSHGLPPRLVM